MKRRLTAVAALLCAVLAQGQNTAKEYIEQLKRQKRTTIGEAAKKKPKP